MGAELVTSSTPNDAGGGGEFRQPSFRYGDKFEKECAYYMAMGMTYEEYWDGDNLLPRYYREMYNIKRDRDNYNMWLQGVYFYEALVDASPAFNPFSKTHTPLPYREMPIPITQEEADRQTEIENQKRLEAGREAMRTMMNEFNKRFMKEKGGKE